MTDLDFLKAMEQLLETQIASVKKVHFIPNKGSVIKGLSKLVDKSREMQKNVT